MTDLLRTRPKTSDCDELSDLRANPKVAATLGGALSSTESNSTLARWLGYWEEFGFGPWIFRDAKSEVLIGYAGLQPVETRSTFELAYALRPEYWGRGLGTLMAEAALADETIRENSIEVVAWCLTTNDASRRILEKLGFRMTGTVSRAGQPHFAWCSPKLGSADESSGAA